MHRLMGAGHYVHHLALAHPLAHRSLGMVNLGVGGFHQGLIYLKGAQTFLISGSRHAQTGSERASIGAAPSLSQAFIHSSFDMYEFFMASLRVC
jgi:hypothetical protein